MKKILIKNIKMGLCYERNISNYTKSRISLLAEKKVKKKI